MQLVKYTGRLHSPFTVAAGDVHWQTYLSMLIVYTVCSALVDPFLPSLFMSIYSVHAVSVHNVQQVKCTGADSVRNMQLVKCTGRLLSPFTVAAGEVHC